MDLHPGESVIAQEGASHFEKFIAIAGELTLTSKRLMFRGTHRFAGTEMLELEICQIDKVDFFRSFNIAPNGLMVMIADGSIENFIVDDRKKWKELIMMSKQATKQIA